MATRARNKLSARFIAKGDLKQGRYGDGAGLYLNVTPSLTKNWVLIVVRNNVRREVGLGSVHDVTLADAREKAEALRRAVANGRDVLEAKRVDQSILNFRQSALCYVEAKRDGWKNPRVEARWLQILELKEVAALNSRSVRNVDLQDVLKAVNPLWHSKPTTGQFLVGMIKRTLAWAGAHGHRDANASNPGDWQNVLKHVMSAPKKGGNHPAMPYKDVPVFVQTLRQTDSVYARALEFVILVWARKREGLEMVWSEVDLDNALWTVPAKRMKGNVQHEVPLSDRALAILRVQYAATGGKGLVFPSAATNKVISNVTLGRLIPSPYTLHGMRATASTWAGNETEFPFELAEMALAHTVGNAVARAYRRGKALERRRELMVAWATYLGGPSSPQS